MIRRISILFILFPLISFSQIESFNSVSFLSKNVHSNIKFNNSIFNITPRYYINSSFNKKSIVNTYIFGLNTKSFLSKNLTFNYSIDNFSGDYNDLLQEHKDSLTVIPYFGTNSNNIQFNLNYNLNKFINIEFGKGTHFIGNGFHSLLFSSTHPYPFLRFTTKFGKIKYYNLYTSFSNLNTTHLNSKKYATIHYLDIGVNDFINIGFFESIIWRSWDGINNVGYEIGYLNPIIFYRPVEFSMGSGKANALIGINLNYSYKNNVLYSQLLLDDLNISRQKDKDDDYQEGFIQNKFAYQIGLYSKLNKLDFLLEYNQVQPYTYGHRDVIQNYSHSNNSLAHPIGANFKEIITNLKYTNSKWIYNLHCNYIKIGLDTFNSHYGHNIFISERSSSTGGGKSYGNFNGQGLSTNFFIIKPELSYRYKYFDIFSSIYYIKKKSELKDQTSFWYSFGIRTFLFSFFPLVS